jgi:hypothetical protein
MDWVAQRLALNYVDITTDTREVDYREDEYSLNLITAQ